MARPRVAILSKNLIRDQALSIIDENGLDALTMRRLAGRLGVQAASLYSHFPNKHAVLDAIVDRLSKSIDPHGFEDNWQQGLSIWATSYYQVINLHPNTTRVFAASTRERSEHLSMIDQIHVSLLRHGWPDRAATMVIRSTTYLVLGAATTTFGSGDVSNLKVSVDLYPNLSRAHLLKSVADSIDRDSFLLALDSLIRGLEPVHAALDATPNPI